VPERHLYVGAGCHTPKSVIVAVAVVGPVIVAVHVHGNATVDVIAPATTR
jgi:hypothetical protein